MPETADQQDAGFDHAVDATGTLSYEGQIHLAQALGILTVAIRRNNFQKGWRSPGSPLRNFGEVCMLIDTETAEAYEAYREGMDPTTIRYEYEFNGYPELLDVKAYCVPGHRADHLGKPVGIASELADVVIRVLDIADEFNIPLVQAILEKHAYNQTRPWRHGGKLA